MTYNLQGILQSHEQRLAQIEANNNNLAAQCRQLGSLYGQLQGQLAAPGGLGNADPAAIEQLRAKISELEQSINFDSTSLARPRTISDIPGIRTPRWYTVEIAIPAASTTQANNTINIDPAGPFIITQMQAQWVYTDSTISPAGLLNRVFPVTAFHSLINNGAATAIATVATNIALIPELSFEIEIAGSGRKWTSQKIYGPSLYGVQNPLYYGQEGWVDTTDSIRTYVNPEVAMTYAGKAVVTYTGFQILTSLRISEMLGFPNKK